MVNVKTLSLSACRAVKLLILFKCIVVLATPVSADTLMTDLEDCLDEYSRDPFVSCARAAERGQVLAQLNLGYLYEKGQGTRKDLKQAISWYRKAAEQGNAKAQYNLAVMYDNGRGVKKDYEQAAYWYLEAAIQDHPGAQSNLGFLYEKGQGIEQDSTQAVKWYRRAAMQGDEIAQANLGLMYANGNGVDRNFVEAYRWWYWASKNGDKMSKRNLKKVTSLMKPDQIASAKMLIDEGKPTILLAERLDN